MQSLRKQQANFLLHHQGGEMTEHCRLASYLFRSQGSSVPTDWRRVQNIKVLPPQLITQITWLYETEIILISWLLWHFTFPFKHHYIKLYFLGHRHKTGVMITTEDSVSLSLPLCPFLWKHQFFSTFLYCFRSPQDWLFRWPSRVCHFSCWVDVWLLLNLLEAVMLPTGLEWKEHLHIRYWVLLTQSHIHKYRTWALASDCLEPNPSFALVVIQLLRCQFPCGKQWYLLDWTV